MRRKPTKRWKVDEWTHRGSGTVLAVYYDKNSKEFWSRVGPRMVSASTQKEARAEANKLANAILVSEDGWRRVLEVSVSKSRGHCHYHNIKASDSHNSPTIGFSMVRYWVRDAPNGKRYTRQWDREPRGAGIFVESNRKQLACFSDVCDLYGSGLEDAVKFPYSDELWESLERFSARIKTIGDALEAIVKSDNFVAAITSGADVLALPPAVVEEPKP